MVTILVSRAAATRLAPARSWLAGDGPGDAPPALVLAGSRRAGLQLVREVVAERGGALGIEVLTPAQLAAELLLAAGDAVAPLTPLGSEALLARALARCRDEGPLAYFEEVAGAPGLPRALVRTLTELRHHGVAPAALASRGARGADLARLLTAYEEELAAAGLADVPALLARAAAIAGEEPPTAPHRRHVGARLLLLDLALRSPREAALVAALASRAPDVLAVAPHDDATAIARLARALGAEAQPLVEQATDAGALARARATVFRGEVRAATVTDDSFALFSAPGEGAECVEIARRLLALGAAGVPFDRCAVLLRDAARYQPLLEQALDRAGVPALFTRGVVRPHAAGRALLALLDCALESLSASRFAEYLSLGQVPPVDAAGAPPPQPVPWVEPDEEERLQAPPSGTGAIDAEGVSAAAMDDDATAGVEDDSSPVLAGSLRAPLNWERLLVEAAVIGGLDRWQRRLAGLHQELELHLAASDDDGTRAHLGRQLARLSTLERFALPLVEELASLPAAALWGDWLTRLERLAVRALREPRRVLETLAELRPMADVGPVTLAEVRLALAERLTSLRASPQGVPFGRLLVAGIEEARGRSFHTVFLPGLAEGVFPRRALEDPLLLDADRAALAAGLSTQESRVADERLLLTLALGAAEEGFVASFPTLDAREGRARVPSFYALDLARAVEGSLPSHGELLRRAAAAAALRLGWPAPREAAAAIDAEEYDLAVLAPLLTAPREAAHGRARFLLELEPALGRSLRARWQRWSHKFTSADGLVDPDSAAREALAAHAPTRRPYSATALQNLAACPYRFLLHAIHGLRPREEAAPLEELDPLTKGTLFHAVQARLLGELRRREWLPLADAHAAAALDLLDEVLDVLAGEYRERLAPALPRVWESEIEEMRVDLRGWVRELHEAPPGPFSRRRYTPAHFELAFGMQADNDRDPASRREPVNVLGRLLLRGAIDCVETEIVDPTGGGDAGKRKLRATDFKTGRAPDTQGLAIGGGESLQPLLYALAAGEILGRPADWGRLYFCTRRGGYRTLEVAVQPLNLAALGAVLDLLDDSLARGFLPAAPRKDACAHCDYRAVCGPWEETRIQGKPQRALERLTDVRSYE